MNWNEESGIHSLPPPPPPPRFLSGWQNTECHLSQALVQKSLLPLRFSISDTGLKNGESILQYTFNSFISVTKWNSWMNSSDSWIRNEGWAIHALVWLLLWRIISQFWSCQMIVVFKLIIDKLLILSSTALLLTFYFLALKNFNVKLYHNKFFKKFTINKKYKRNLFHQCNSLFQNHPLFKKKFLLEYSCFTIFC